MRRELNMSIDGKSPRCKEPGLHVTVKVPVDEARSAGLIRGPGNCLGPRAREFAGRLSDAAHGFLDEAAGESEDVIPEVEEAWGHATVVIEAYHNGEWEEAELIAALTSLRDAVGRLPMSVIRGLSHRIPEATPQTEDADGSDTDG
jgi:hypothetical protein